MRVLFAGSELNPLSIAVFDALAQRDEFTLALLASQPHRRGFVQTLGRVWRENGPATVWRGGTRLVASRLRLGLRAAGVRIQGFASLSEAAVVRRCSVLPAGTINSPATLAHVRAFAPDVLLVAAFDQILKAPVLGLPRLGCVNVHPSLLPAHRGSNPFYWVARGGETETGVSFHLIDEGIDTGPLLAQEKLAVGAGDDERSLQRRSAQAAARMAPGVLIGLRDGTLSPWAQPEAGASYDPKPPRGGSRL